MRCSRTKTGEDGNEKKKIITAFSPLPLLCCPYNNTHSGTQWWCIPACKWCPVQISWSSREWWPRVAIPPPMTANRPRKRVAYRLAYTVRTPPWRSTAGKTEIKHAKEERSIFLRLKTYGCQFVYIFVRRAERSQTEFLRELRETWIREQRHVAQQFVAAISANIAGYCRYFKLTDGIKIARKKEQFS